LNQRDLVINGVLLVLILAVAYLLATFRPTKLVPPSKALKGRADTTGTVVVETGFGPPVGTSTRYALLVKIRPFDTIIPTPTPTPTPKPTPPPPPPIGLIMNRFELIMMDPPRSVMLQDKKSQEMIEWKVGETKEYEYKGRKLPITLKVVDPNDFHATFTAPDLKAPDGQKFSYRFF